ncbi:Intersectin 1 (SH3 domain protein) [Dimargaris cristalligena]|nr:Intersectin 1 (SH3 domain protein) [Dimargaris cristalligena]
MSDSTVTAAPKGTPGKPSLPAKPALKPKPAVPTKPVFLTNSGRSEGDSTAPSLSHAPQAQPEAMEPTTLTQPAPRGPQLPPKPSGYTPRTLPITKPSAPPVPSREGRTVTPDRHDSPTATASATPAPGPSPEPPSAGTSDRQLSGNTRSLISRFNNVSVSSPQSEDILTPILEAQSKKFPRFKEAGPHDLSPPIPVRSPPERVRPMFGRVFEDVPLNAAETVAPKSTVSSPLPPPVTPRPGSASSAPAKIQPVCPPPRSVPATTTIKSSTSSSTTIATTTTAASATTSTRPVPPPIHASAPPPLPIRTPTYVAPPPALPSRGRTGPQLQRAATTASVAPSRHNSDYEMPDSVPSSVGRSGSVRAPMHDAGPTRMTAQSAIPRAARRRYDSLFRTTDSDHDGLLTRAEAKAIFLRSCLSEDTLGDIWSLCDRDRRGKLSQHEFAIAMYLIDETLAGEPVPKTLPLELLIGSNIGQLGLFFGVPLGFSFYLWTILFITLELIRTGLYDK